MRVVVHIDELVLHGVDPRDRWAIGDAVQRELARLLAEQGVADVQRSIDVPRLDAGSIAIPARGAAAGAPIAAALHAALGGKR